MRLTRSILHALAYLWLAGAATAAWACSCLPETDEQRFAAASAVLVVRIEALESGMARHRVVPAGPTPVWRASYVTLEVLKGTVADRGTVLDLRDGAGSCTVGLEPGDSALLFLYDDLASVDLCGGSVVLTNTSGSGPAERLARVRALAARSKR